MQDKKTPAHHKQKFLNEVLVNEKYQLFYAKQGIPKQQFHRK
jgi:hypothetical protein